MLKIAVQSKGRLHDETMKLLEEAGLKFNRGKRTLLLQAEGLPVEVLFLRDDDIPQAVAGGAADIGIVGENECLEKGYDVRLLKRLGFGHCRMSLAIPKDEDYDGIEWFQNKTIATSYPNILNEYLIKNKVYSEFHLISGSVEIAPGIGMADAIFDIVSSGTTLLNNHLKEVETVIRSEALLVVTPNISGKEQNILDELCFRIEAVVAARGKKYVMMNAPKESISKIAVILPGMKSPTITPLADENWISIQSVIDEESFWENIGLLKAFGAENILILPIEKMIL
jgi:ATP phosphoribosyltransferase